MVFNNNLLLGAAGQGGGQAPFDPTLIGNSVWLDGSADDLDRSTTSHSSTEVVMACWFQLNTFSGNVGLMGLGTGTSGSTNAGFWFSNGTVYFYCNGQGATTNQLLRDIGWYHILGSWKLDESGTNKGKLFINGEEVTSFSADPRSSWGTSFGSTATQSVGSIFTNTFLNGYIAQPIMLDGQSIQGGDVAITDFVDTFTFGTNGSQIIPKADADIAALASTAGGNSFCLDFANSSDLGNDISANNNDFTPNSMSSANQSTNTPSLAYPSLTNIIPASESGQGMSTLTNGNLSVAAQTNRFARSAMIVNSTFSKLYYEVTFDTVDATYDYPRVGIALTSYTGNDLWSPGAFAGSGYGLQANTSTVMLNGSNLGTNAGFSSGDVCMLAFDPATGKIWTGKNGTYFNSGDPAGGTGEVATITGDEWKIFVGGVALSGSAYSVNFGQSAFAHTVPVGFASLASSNLSAPDYQGIDYFDSTLYEGNGTGQRVGDFVPFTDAFNVANSAMFQHDDVRALSRTIGTPSSTGGKKGTWSVWYKTGVIDTDNIFFDTGTTATNRFSLQMDASGQITFVYGAAAILKTSADLKGGGLWRNLVLKVDTSLGTAADRAIMYIDGVEVTSFATDNRASLTQDGELGYMDSGATQFVGSYNGVTVNQWDGYFAETIFLDNQFLSADSFGQLDTSTNKWVPKDVSGLTFGDQGFYLKYENSPTNIAAGKTGLKSDDLDVGAVSLLTDGTQYGSWNAGSNLVYQNANSTTKSWWGVDFGSGVTKTIKSATIFGNQPGDGSSAGFTSVSGAVTWTLFGSNSAQATSDNDLSSLTSLGTASVADGISKGAAVTIDASSNTTAFRYFYVQMDTTASLRRLLGEIQLYETAGGGIANDSSGQNNDLVAFGAWATSDQFIDTPSKNFATLDPGRAGSGVVLSEGNLKASSTDNIVLSTMPIPESGKWAFTANIDALDFSFGVVSEQNSLTTKIGRTATSWGIIESTGASLFQVEHNSVGSFNLGSQPSVNNKLIAAIDMDTNSLWLGYDTGSGFTYFGGGNPATGATPTYQGVLVSGQRLYFAVGRQLSVSFGGQSASLYGTLPTGFLELNQDNLDDTASKITAWAWIKNRDSTDSHILVDRVRGVGEVIHSNETAAETTEPNTVQRFLQRGVQVGSDVQVNTANESYVLWQWLMGDSATTGTVNNDGSIASTLIAADADHLSIGTYTGTGANATVGHGLTGAPEFVNVKQLNSTASWSALIPALGNSKAIFLNLPNAAQTVGASYWQNTDPTSTVFSVGTDNGVNALSSTYVFQCFRSVPGVCKVGTYVGNLNADGPYIDLGFTPRFFLVKVTDGTNNWGIFDTARNTFNASNRTLNANDATVEDTSYPLDILSNGVKIRGAFQFFNDTGKTYLYIAMADIGGNGTLPPIYGR